jgi:hypothetical protein
VKPVADDRLVMRAPRRLLIALCAAACLAGGGTRADAGRYHPRLRFQCLRTPHFTIYYHQGEEQVARRLGGIAEAVRGDLCRRTTLDAPAHVHVVLVDQSDVSNGWTTPVPYDLIEIAAVPPAPSSFLGHEDDWLRTVFAHEFAHVLQLDRVGGLMTVLRRVLGRHPATFPNLYAPDWQVEGFATWAEGAATGLGRNHAADVAAVISTSTAAGGMTVDRAGGGLVAWPAGHASYLFGGRVYEQLEARASAAALGEVARRTARRLPYFGAGAFTAVFGAPPRRLWLDTFRAAAPDAARTVAPVTRLTRDGYVVTGPRVVRTEEDSGNLVDTVYFSTQGPHRFPEIRRIALGAAASAPVTSRLTGDTLSIDGRWVFFDQLEYDGAVALVSDLWAFDLRSGRAHRLSQRQRVTDPDVDRTGTRLVAVRAADGAKRLVVWPVGRVAGGRPALALEPERTMGAAGCDYATPRWSPDGTRIAAVRQCLGSLPAVVVLDANGGKERAIARAAGSRDVTPAWTPDGRMVLFASDRRDHRFKIYGVPEISGGIPPAAEPVALVDAPGGAIWPDVSPDGRTVVFTSLTADGYDVFAAPMPDPVEFATSESRTAIPPPVTDSGDVAPARAAESGVLDSMTARSYSPWRTLVPRAWLPFARISGDRLDLGAAIGASDALGYHAYQVSASWRASGNDADVPFGRPALEWSSWYSYNRWRASMFVSASNTIDTVSVTPATADAVRTFDERTREVAAGVLVPWRRARMAQDWLASIDLETRRLPGSAGIADRQRNALRAAWSLSTAHTFGYSISPERGAKLSVTLERVSPALGADGQATSWTADGRAYLPAFGRHDVVAIRAAVGSSTGDRVVRRSFTLGEPVLPISAFGFSKRSVGLLRGPGSDAFAGSAVAVANFDYRFPLLRVERGVRTWPFFVRDVHGAVFADIGAAGPTLREWQKPVSAVGAELASRLTLGYALNLTIAAGVSWVHDPARVTGTDRAAAFVRTGYAF